jgi:hypothetical protein
LLERRAEFVAHLVAVGINRINRADLLSSSESPQAVVGRTEAKKSVNARHKVNLLVT